MIDYVQMTGKRFQHLENDKVPLPDLLSKRDNTRPHTTQRTQVYFVERDISVVKQCLYSLDLTLCDQFLFRVLKSEVKHDAYNSRKEVISALQRCFRGNSENTLSEQLVKLRNHRKLVRQSGGDYISSQ